MRCSTIISYSGTAPWIHLQHGSEMRGQKIDKSSNFRVNMATRCIEGKHFGALRAVLREQLHKQTAPNVIAHEVQGQCCHASTRKHGKAGGLQAVDDQRRFPDSQRRLDDAKPGMALL